MTKRFQMPVAAHLLLKKENNVLLLLRKNTGYEDGKYSVVAGHFDGNERGTEAMIREAKEEAGITILSEDLELACVMHRKAPDGERVDFFYACNKWQGKIKNMEPEKCGELIFVPNDKIPQNTIEYVRAGIDASINGLKYIEFGW